MELTGSCVGMSTECKHGKFPVLQFATTLGNAQMFGYLLELSNYKVCPCQKKSLAHWVVSEVALR